jgi:regulatory protein
LKVAGLIDDVAFAKAWSENRSTASPRSAYVVKRELRTKGIDAETAEEATVELDDAEAAYRAALPRLKRLQSLPPEEARRKLSDFLRRRGFGWTIVERTLGRLREEGLSTGG